MPLNELAQEESSTIHIPCCLTPILAEVAKHPMDLKDQSEGPHPPFSSIPGACMRSPSADVVRRWVGSDHLSGASLEEDSRTVSSSSASSSGGSPSHANGMDRHGFSHRPISGSCAKRKDEASPSLHGFAPFVQIERPVIDTCDAPLSGAADMVHGRFDDVRCNPESLVHHRHHGPTYIVQCPGGQGSDSVLASDLIDLRVEFPFRLAEPGDRGCARRGEDERACLWQGHEDCLHGRRERHEVGLTILRARRRDLPDPSAVPSSRSSDHRIPATSLRLWPVSIRILNKGPNIPGNPQAPSRPSAAPPVSVPARVSAERSMLARGQWDSRSDGPVQRTS